MPTTGTAATRRSTSSTPAPHAAPRSPWFRASCPRSPGPAVTDRPLGAVALPGNVARSTIVEEGETPPDDGGVPAAKERAMPAVTVDDILVLPRVAEPDPTVAADRLV